MTADSCCGTARRCATDGWWVKLCKGYIRASTYLNIPDCSQYLPNKWFPVPNEACLLMDSCHISLSLPITTLTAPCHSHVVTPQRPLASPRLFAFAEENSAFAKEWWSNLQIRIICCCQPQWRTAKFCLLLNGSTNKNSLFSVGANPCKIAKDAAPLKLHCNLWQTCQHIGNWVRQITRLCKQFPREPDEEAW